jgi:hypothetical protein
MKGRRNMVSKGDGLFFHPGETVVKGDLRRPAVLRALYRAMFPHGNGSGERDTGSGERADPPFPGGEGGRKDDEPVPLSPE